MRFLPAVRFAKSNRRHAITGKIVVAPDMVSDTAGSRLTVSWQTTDPKGAEVRVTTRGGDEKLVSRGQSGEAEVPWLINSTECEFRLYAMSQPDAPIDTVKMRPNVDSRLLLSELTAEVARGNVDLSELSEFIAAAVSHCLKTGQFTELFRMWERRGFHVTPVHFYQPVPDTRTLSESLWKRASELVGVDMNDALQLHLLRDVFPKFRHEYEQFPSKPTGEAARFYFNNGFFDGTDALVAYCMFRHFQPRLIIEVGSGFSSLITAEAVARGNKSELICIEPFPRDFLRQKFPGLRALVESKVEDVDLEFFNRLENGDVLFIDSSHTVKIGGDVNYLFLEVLPRLKPGVIVHIHDVLLPLEYRRDWVMDELRFWTEQYLLQAFLSFNTEFEVIMANSYLGLYYLEDLKCTFPNSPWWADARPNVPRGGGSFWMRRRVSSQS